MGVSLDGYVAGPAGQIDWSAPDEELHRLHNHLTSQIGVHLCGRRLYETMVCWETAERRPGLADFELEFAGIWQAIPKLVFSTTLDHVEGNASLATGSLADEVARLKAEPGGDIEVGGPGLASQCIQLGLVDEFRLFVSPVVLGGGTPYFPPLAQPIDVELSETRTFAGRVLYLRYMRTDGRD